MCVCVWELVDVCRRVMSVCECGCGCMCGECVGCVCGMGVGVCVECV